MSPPGHGSDMRLRTNLEVEEQGKASPSTANVPPPVTEFKSPLDKKYHVERSALLGLGKSPSLSGFMNLLFCLTTLAAAGLLLENLNKYGFRVAMTQWMRAFDARRNVPGFYPAVYLFLYMPVQIFVALGIEKAIALERVTEAQGMKAHFVNLLWHVAYPVVGIWAAAGSMSILGGVMLCQINAMVFLKMWSFVQACWWAREKRRNKAAAAGCGEQAAAKANGVGRAANGAANGGHVAAAAPAGPQRAVIPARPTEYPDNLTVGNMAYFTVAPTLCYEMDYPRHATINWRRVLVRGPMLVVVFLLHMSMAQQWLIPSYTAVLTPLANGEWFVVAERLCKIAIPNNLVWLVFFYELFHVNMILVSELTRFADRRSYDSWWDSEDMNVFWRRWNLPVHHWCIRHLYLPLLRMGWSKSAAKWATFVFSGVFHEYLVSPPTRMFRLYAFFGMLAQVPIGDLSEWMCKRMGPRWGNAVVWFSICVGQPLSVLLYVRDYVVAYDGPEALAVIGSSAFN